MGIEDLAVSDGWYDGRVARSRRSVSAVRGKGADLCVRDVTICSQFLPPRTTGGIQSCDTGYIASLKCYWRLWWFEASLSRRSRWPGAHVGQAGVCDCSADAGIGSALRDGRLGVMLSRTAGDVL
eukprot:TRINITY_DN4514_c0_g2_i2.p1 TRINITY_DN4514_c0_g2~~TRINITY_DN4514_c0_g2_i2.p1  ORF type:complete len:125 (+),score=11.75 TRINITY_DN4514_c0_g2_i2:415-789(+)